MSPEEAAQHFIDNLSPETIKDIKDRFFEEIKKLSDIEHKKLDDLLIRKANLEKEKQDLYDQEKSADSNQKMALFTKRNLLSLNIKAMDPLIIGQRNIVLALKNGGGISSMSDKKGKSYDNIADFTEVPTNSISFNEETILTDTPPPYIPFINEYEFKLKGYVFDAIRISSDRYIFAPNGYREDNSRRDVQIKDLPKEQDSYIIVTLDQLALISDYYYTKAKAKAQKDADDANQRAEESWDRMDPIRRESFLNQKNQAGLYAGLPAKEKKKITLAEWTNLTWQEKEKIYKFYKRTGAKRLVSKLDDKHMWRSFHEMYERFINPLAVHPKPGTANNEVWAYWVYFRDMMDWKIKDLAVERESDSEVRKIALETSFGDSNISDALKSQLGIFVKRQNGSQISPIEIEQIRESFESVEKIFGHLSFNSNEDNLKISHTGDKYVFASKAAGMYIPSMNAIAVTNKFGSEQFNSTLSHELAHWIDGMLGKKLNKRHVSSNYESTAGQIAYTVKKNLNKKSTSDYVNSSVECFARGLQLYYAVETNGDDARIYYSYVDLHGNIPYFIEDNYVSKETYYNKLKPLIEKFLEENKGFFKGLITDKTMEEENMVSEIKEENKSDLHFKFPDYNPPIDIEKWNAPVEFTYQFPLVDEHIYHSENKYRLPAEKTFSDGKIQIRVKEAKTEIEVSVRELHPEGYRDGANMDKSSSYLDDKYFLNEKDLNEYLLSIPSKFADVYRTIDQVYYDAIGLQEMSESYSDCLKRNGINLEKDNHRFEVGTKIKDNVAGTTIQVKSINENNISFNYISALSSNVSNNFNNTYSNLIDVFSTGGISVEGFSPDEKMEFARVLNTIQHCIKMDKLHKENKELKIENKELSNRAESILQQSIEVYNNSSDEKKLALIKIVKDQLAINDKGEESIGFGLDKDMVAAGRRFIDYVEPSKNKINIGDEGMWHGAERRVIDVEGGNAIIIEIGTDKKTTVALSQLNREFSVFPEEDDLLIKKAQKDDYILSETKRINALKEKRNKLPKSATKKRKGIQNEIDIAENDLSKMRGETSLEDYQSAISGAEVMLEMAEGKEKEEWSDYIEGLKIMIM